MALKLALEAYGRDRAPRVDRSPMPMGYVSMSISSRMMMSVPAEK